MSKGMIRWALMGLIGLGFTPTAWAQIPEGIQVPSAVPAPVPQQPARDAIPAFIKPGTRLTFHAGDSVLRGTRLIPDPKGMIKRGNEWFRPEEGRSGGGVGLIQVNILAASPEAIIADIGTYVNVDLQNNIVVGSGNSLATGNAKSLDKYWIHPALLAQLTPGDQPDGQTVSRDTYDLNGQRYEVVTMRSSGKQGHRIHSYDVRSGILISGGTINTDEGMPVNDPNGVPQGQVEGSAVLSHIRFAGVRDTKIPWADAPTPPWVQKGATFNYQGGTRAVIQGGGGLPPLPPSAVAVSVAFGDVIRGNALATVAQRADQGHGLPPSESSSQRCFGSAMFNGMWIAPQAVANLQPNQVLDQDPLTGYRVVFIGAQNGFVGVVEQGPQESIERYYDAPSGLLRSFRITRNQANIGQQVSEYQLVGQ